MTGEKDPEARDGLQSDQGRFTEDPQPCPPEEKWWLLLDGRLQEEEKARLSAHRLRCPECAEKWRNASRLIKALESEAPPEHEQRRVVWVVLRRDRRRRIIKAALGAVSAVAACLVIAFWIFGAFSGKRGSVPQTGSSSGGELQLAVEEPQNKSVGGEDLFSEELPPLKTVGGAEVKLERSEDKPGSTKVRRFTLACGAVCESPFGSELTVLENSAQRCRISLAKGTVRCSVPHPVELFQVSTPVVEVVVHGTVFSVTHDPVFGRSEVNVERGRVLVQDHAGELLKTLSAGQWFSTGPASEEESPLREETYPEDHLPGEHPRVPVDLPDKSFGKQR